MVTFRVFFRHGVMEVIQARGAVEARAIAANIARERGTTVSKVKRAKDV